MANSDRTVETATLFAQWCLRRRYSLATAQHIFRNAIVAEALRTAEGNETRAARALHIHRNTILNILKESKRG